MSSWHGGKGSTPRPILDRKKFEENWDRIFNKNKSVEEQFWDHYCQHNGRIMISSGKSCPWCGEEESTER